MDLRPMASDLCLVQHRLKKADILNPYAIDLHRHFAFEARAHRVKDPHVPCTALGQLVRQKEPPQAETQFSWHHPVAHHDIEFI
eukprot:CAMPEP_0198515424 /NCGR_PEP_ID=MMETSP1462-20131121/17310_1 /TAXON_ID=1333877 /ORGANISM="Brandtodinium nutriculum, Strain RCC3387" /LENGTH=83 /DNA_ID=CAMNT_0044244921 /DNA_START=237 /DNA_END=485 /DNA_ORIENTATION=+